MATAEAQATWEVRDTFSTHNHPTRFWETYIFAPYGLVATAHGETEESSRLFAAQIAAAPDLLEALKDVTERLALSLQVFGNSPDIVNGNVAKARAAIAKAEGRAAQSLLGSGPSGPVA